jgi:hypothetical protein
VHLNHDSQQSPAGGHRAVAAGALGRAARHRRRGASLLARSVAGATLAAAMAGAVAVAPAAAVAVTSSASRSSALVTVAAAPRLPAGATVVGSVAPAASLSAAVALALPDQQAVTQFIDQASNPHSPTYRQYLAPGQFASRFGPSHATIAAVEQQLTADGLKVTGLSSNDLLMQFKGSAATVESAFHTGLEKVHLVDGSTGQATTSSVRIPASIASDVQAVVGLDQLVKETAGPAAAPATHDSRTRAAAAPATSNGGPVACAAALAQQANGGLTDQQVADSYGVDGLYDARDLASGQTIDVYELEPFEMSDIATFDDCYFGTNNTRNITVTPVDGGPGTGYGSAEAALDVEDVSGLAPDAKIDVFSGPNMNDQWGPLDTWNQIAITDNARQITSSWGACEPALQQGAPGVEQVENEIFEQIAAQGQTVFAAAGDDGSDSCAYHGSSPTAPVLSVLDPADQPYVTSVGGTTILDATDPPTETVWDNGNDGGAGGGGISNAWAQQPWQSAVAVPQGAATQVCSNDPTGIADNYHVAGIDTLLTAGTLCREAPDVSALADPQTGITIVYGGSWTPIGGTSSATPLWAAMLAEINASSGCSTVPDGVGFVDPSLYQIADSSTTYADAFNDVTQGDNDNLGIGAGESGYPFYSAGTGYDMASGLGTPKVTNASNTGLGEQLCAIAAGAGGTQPEVTSVLTSGSKSSGPSAGGTAVTISGSNFGASAGSVYFGSVKATVGTWSGTSITLDTPPYYAPPGTAAGSAGSADVTVVSSTGESSGPSSAAVFHYDGNAGGRPVVDYIDPPGGPQAGGSDRSSSGTVDIVGSGFTGATSVSFGGVSVTPDVLSDNEIKVTPPHDTGADCFNGGIAATGVCAVAVTVTTPGGTSLKPSNGGPAILAAYTGPIIDSPNGAFSPACMTAATPTCEVIQAPEEYDYADAPTVSAVAPQGGGGYASEAGGTLATVTGTGFNILTMEWVNVGTAGLNPDEDFSVTSVSPTSLTVALSADPNPSAPTTNPDPSELSVQTSAGLSSAESFSFAGVPVFGAITHPNPPIVAQAKPAPVTVTGEGLSDVFEVSTELEAPLSFLASTSNDITARSGTSLTADLTSNFAFAQDLLLCSATACTAPTSATGGTADVLEVAYPGRPVVTSSSPSSGPAVGGTLVTINGALDTEVTAVDFGTVPGKIVNQGGLTASAPIEVLAPPGVARKKVDLTIKTDGGILVGQPTSAPTAAATFTYAPSAPTAPLAVSATSGPGLVAASWKPPANDGGDRVVGYLVRATAHGQPTVTRNVGPTQTKTLFAPLSRVPWTVTVEALNSLGTGAAGSSAAVTPGALPLEGYWLATADGAVYATGYALQVAGTTTPASDPIVGIAAAPGGGGYWVVSRDGKVTARGSAPYEGEIGSGVTDVVSIVATEDGLGYWLVGADGQVYPFGDATFHGDLLHITGGKPVHVKDIVGMVAAQSGGGYILIASDGGVFVFGAAHYYGSLPGLRVHVNNIRGIIPAPSGTGYILVASDGGTFVFGHGAPFEGSLPGRHIHVSDIVALTLTPNGQGYWLAGSNGDTYAFGDAILFGTPAGLASHLPVAGIAGT